MQRRFLLLSALGAPVLAQTKTNSRTLTFEEFQRFVMIKMQKEYKGRLELLGEPQTGVWRLQRLVPPVTEIFFALAGPYEAGKQLKKGQDPQSFVAGLLDPFVQEEIPLTDIQERLFPRLVSVRNYKKLWGNQAPITASLHPDLVWMVVMDLPDTVWPVIPAQQQRWGITDEQLRTLAQQNISRRTDIPFIVAGERNGIWVVRRGDGFDAERMLVPDLLQAIRSTKTNPLLLSAPSQNWLIILENTDPTAADRLRQVAERIQKQDAAVALPTILFSYDQKLQPY